MPGPGHFDAHAAAYDRGRPPYPAALWERLHDLGLLGPGVRVLELGAGTGKATGPMVEAGASVLAVEPGERLAARLRDRWPRVEVVVGTAEEVDLAPGAFDWRSPPRPSTGSTSTWCCRRCTGRSRRAGTSPSGAPATATPRRR